MGGRWGWTNADDVELPTSSANVTGCALYPSQAISDAMRHFMQ
jgi:hypothetical protein